jgi:D-alanine-D-alanine ligase
VRIKGLAGGAKSGGSLKKLRVAVLMGGVSREREISLKTGAAVLGALLSSGYNAFGIDAGPDVPLKLKKLRASAVFIALHGRHGEDGCIQGLLEIMGIPYTGSGPRASAMAMDKVVTKKLFSYHGVRAAEFSECASGSVRPGLTLPIVVKPVREGSAIGVSVVRRWADYRGAFLRAARSGGPGMGRVPVMAEKFIEGRELTVSILDSRALPIIEIRPKGGLYDFHAKYTVGAAEFIVPAKIAKFVEKRVLKEALSAYNALGCSGAARVDIILDRAGSPYVLEVNTVPGLTERSLFPMAAARSGLGYARLVGLMLKSASINKG